MKVSRMALVAALAIGGASVAIVPAEAQRNRQPAQPQTPAGRQYTFSKEERAALAPLQAAVAAKDWVAAAAALPAAQAAAKGPDAKYAVAQYQLQWGIDTNNVQLQSQAIDALAASGGALPAELPNIYLNQGGLAFNAGNHQKAEAAYARAIELSPGNADLLIDQAKVKVALRKPQEAGPLVERAIAARLAASQAVPESWYKYALKLSFDSKLKPQSLKISRDLLTAYPTPQNWRDALLIYRDLGALDKGTELDVLRLMRATKSLSGERDWYELADSLQTSGFSGESKSVLEEGARLGMIDLAKPHFRELLRTASARAPGGRTALPGLETRAMAGATGALALSTADAYFSYGDYAKAAALYRAAIQKGSIDLNLANSHLGMALALAGNKAEAEAAFRAVTGPRADVSAFWLLWLSQRA